MMIDYDELASQFEQSLLHTLRGHAAGLELLETWVPDDDPVRGILNMVEAAQLAGQRAIEIRVSLATLPIDRHGELEDVLAPLGAVSLRRDNGSLVVAIGDTEAKLDLAGVSPDLVGGVRRAFAEMKREGPLPGAGAADMEVSAEEDAVTLSLLVGQAAPYPVRAARHRGGRDPVERAILDAVCAAAEDVPLLDAADHAAIRALHALRDRLAARPVPGIVQPGNAHPALGLGERLLRHGHASFLSVQGGTAERYNDHDAPPGDAWLELSSDARLGRIIDRTAKFLAQAELGGDSIGIEEIQNDLHHHPVRVMVSFADEVEPERKPRLMRQLEAWLKETVEPTLQLYHEPQKDQNRIRRL